MAFPAVFSQFSKRVNSTARPASSGTTVNVELKSPCSIIRPQLELAPISGVNYTALNYCYIGQWNRYYWVEDWTWENGLWVASLHIDVLASWKDNIGASTLYVLRSASNYDLDVVDRMYPAKCGPAYAETSAAIPGWAATQNLIAGWFVIGLINGDNSSNSYGSVSYYALNYNQMRSLLAYMFSDITAWDNITDLSGDIAKPFLDPMQYITTCMFFPIQFSTAGISAVPLKFGYWTAAPSDCTGYPLGSAANTLAWTPAAITLARPGNPYASRGQWVYMEPFATYKLVVWPWGVIDLPSAAISSTGIRLRIYVDYITGVGTLNVYNNISGTTGGEYSQLICSKQCQFGTPMSLSQIVTQFLPSDVLEYARAAGAAVSTAILGDAQGIGNVVGMSATTVQSSGSNGGVCQSLIMGGTAYLQMQYFEPVDENLAENGRPLMANVQISTLSGYCIVMDGDVRLPGTSEEITAVRQFLEGGFYYE